MTTPKLSMPELVVGQAGKELTHNQALAILDQLAQAVVIDKDLTAPPGSPANGAMYIVAAGATGAWSGQSGKLAFWLTTVAAWTFITPADGWSVWVADESARYERIAGVWQVGAGGFSFNRGNILGTVSESAGIPTGAIIERGSNANGEFVRYADGTQICTCPAVAIDWNTSLFQTITMPAAFLSGSSPAGFLSSETNVTAEITALADAICQVTVAPLIRISLRGTLVPGGTGTIRVCAIGRWF